MDVKQIDRHLPTKLVKADWPALLLYFVPSWHQKGTQLEAMNWPGNQRHTIDEIKTVPSWHQKSTELLTPKARYLISILAMASEPVKLQELLDAMGYRNHKTFRDNYLAPLRQVGFVKFTNPEKPTDPDNKYMITETCKIFLGGMV